MRDCGELLLLDDVRSRLRPSGESFVGIRPIEIDRIVGTVDRCCDFDRCRHARRVDLGSRVSAIERAFPGGEFPPIDVVQVDRAFFVIDGHKRVSAARRAGVEMIDANVKGLTVSYPVHADTRASDLATLGAEDGFLRESGLQRARPGVRLRCVSARSYAELLAAVKAHGYDLMRGEGRVLEPEAIAAHWYDCDYRPTLAAAEEAGVAALLACCPDGELYLALHRLTWGAPGRRVRGAASGRPRRRPRAGDIPTPALVSRARLSAARRRARRAPRA
jgi:hypothetical protein